MTKHLHIRRWIIWGLAVSFYFYEYFIRVAPSVMVEDLFRSFHIGAGIVGVISAAYLYAYAPMQLPVGVLMDRFGARKLLTFATLACGLASILFGIAPAVWVTIFARIIMGAGSAFAFIGMIYITSHWFHGKILALLVGVGNSIGMLGAVFGEGPLSEMIHVFTWRPTMIGFGVAGLALGLIIFLTIRNDPKSMEKHAPKKSSSILKSMKLVCKNQQTWINGIVSMMFYTATVAFGGLWAIPFLQQTHGYSNEKASFAASMIYIGWIVAGPIIGHFSDKTCNRKVWILASTLLSILIFCLIVYTPVTAPVWIFSLMFLLGCALAGQLLTYCLAIELNTPDTKGAALAITNFLVFVGGSIVQTVIGFILDAMWKGTMLNNARLYSIEMYKFAMIIFPISLIIGFIFTFFIKEKSKPWCS
ncbi:MAG: MFS transporter [Simkaniaceae bacterium]|nr:MAG: MFS transporter [Simkaniaceae bacterium]